MKEKEEKVMPDSKKHGLANVWYILKLLWQADKGIVIYTMYKNISEVIFYVYFSVYMTQYIFTCIEEKTAFNNLFVMVLLGM